MNGKIIREDRGSAFIITMGLLAIMLIMVAGLTSYIATEQVQGRKQNDSTRAFLIASSAMQKIKADINDPTKANSFAAYFYATNGLLSTGSQYPARCDFFKAANVSTNGLTISYDGYSYTVPTNINMGATLGNWPVNAQIVASRGHSDDLNNLYGRGEIVFRVSAKYPNTVDGTTRTVTETVRFGTSPHKVFDFAYFINNYGWMSGNTITLNGDVRSNRNFDFSSNPKLNGNAYASLDSSGGAGQITGSFTHDSIATWYSRSDTRSRPGSPAASGGATYPSGYDGNATGYQNQQALDMPYIPDLSAYKQMVADQATLGSGSTKTIADVTSNLGGLMTSPLTTDSGGNTVVSSSAKAEPFLAYWDSAASSYRKLQIFDNSSSRNTTVAAVKNAGVLMISGDDTHPIVINGPVVVMGDLVIKGKYVGQGTIFANRNVHIAGNLQAKTPPNFPATDTDPLSTFQTNKTKDMLGMVARGNVVLGNYTLSTFDTVKSYIQPSFTSTYNCGDSDLGYNNTTLNGQPAFNGNYTSWDNGYQSNSDGSPNNSGSSNKRSFYESTLNDTVFNSFAVSDNNSLTQIDAVMYNNHAICGRIGDIQINGTTVARDEAMIYNGHIRFNYDERLHSSHGEDRLRVFLPYQLMKPFTVTWKEGQ